jgi:EpsI family protein
MRDRFSRTRLWITVGVLVASFAGLHELSHGEPIALRLPLQQFPVVLGDWHGQDQPLEQRIANATGADDLLNRTYRDENGKSIGLYVGYYRSQRTGETIHSPKNCLPGTGWEPVRAARLTIPIPLAAPIAVNEYLVEKDGNQYLVLYWYQARGRVLASEYSGKVCLVLDAITRNRTDGALVRLFTSTKDGEDRARERAVSFVRALYPALTRFIPE